ncbi:RNA recognition motif domain-containing protein [Calditrichota bacterium]
MNRRLYVGNLAFSTTSDQLNDLFAEHGEVKEANLITDRDSGRSKGFGFVEMGSDDAAKKAIEALNDHDLDGRNIIVNEAKERESRPARGGFGGGRR